MRWSDGLDDDGPHKAIAASPSDRIGVLAGPGTGKTGLGLMRRVVRLLEEGVPGNRILLLSFTRVAAADLRDKVAELDAPGVEEVRATTLHGYCFGLLQQDAVLQVIQRSPRILMDHEIDLMLRDIGGTYGDIYARRRLLEAFVAGWARVPEDNPNAPPTKRDRDFEDAVMRWLRQHRAMHIGEVVPQAFSYLSNNPAVGEHQRFDYLIVDEYQDLNRLEQELLDVMGSSSALCVAGDDDQSIYSVRYAHPEGILHFVAREDVEDHGLSVCGRCPSSILDVANDLISRAPGRDKPRLSPLTDDQTGAMSIVQFPDLDSEVEGITSVIAADIAGERRQPGDILVLTNWRQLGEAVRARLENVGVPAKSFFKEQLVRSDTAREAIALLRLVDDPEDAPALRVLLGLGDSAGRTDAYQRLLAYGQDKRLGPREVLEGLSEGQTHEVRIPAFERIHRAVASRLARLRDLELDDLVDDLFPAAKEELEELRALALDILPEAAGVSELARSVIEAITQDDVPQHPDFVRVMSLHKSKGLTASAVYVAGCVNGVVPSLGSDEPSEVEAAMQEGRRLFYVAVTRAAEELTLSSSVKVPLAEASARRIAFDRSTIRKGADGRPTVRTVASPYLGELGPSAPRAVRGDEWLGERL